MSSRARTEPVRFFRRNQGELAPKDPAQKLVLRQFHPAPCGGRPVIVAGEVKQPVQSVEQNFLFKFETMNGGRVPRDGGAKKNLPVGEGDHVRFRRIAEEVAVDLRHGRAIDQDEINPGQGIRQEAGKKSEGALKPLPKWTKPQRHFVLLVG
jgi:hypothetical protein